MLPLTEEHTMPNCKVDKDACIGCGLCIGTHPEIFAFGDDGMAEVIADGDEASIEDAVANCPAGAISAE